MARSFSFDHYRIGKRDVRPDRRAAARGNLTRSQASAPERQPAEGGPESSGELRRPAPSSKQVTAPRTGSKTGGQGTSGVARSSPQAPRQLHPEGQDKKRGQAKERGAPREQQRPQHARAAEKRHSQTRVGSKSGGPLPIGALPPVEAGDRHAVLLREHEGEAQMRESMLAEAMIHAAELQRSLADAALALRRLLRVPTGRRRHKETKKE